MKKVNQFLFVVFVSLIGACNNPEEKKPEEKVLSKEEMQAFIKEKETLLKADVTKQENKASAEELVKVYTDFVTAYPQDSSCANYLFKAADVSRGLGRALYAVDLYVKLIDEYPKSDKAPLALFLEGFLFDNELNDDKKAGELYKKFIEKYPEHQLAKDAEFSIKNLGKSDEELIQEFEKNQAKVKA